MSSDSIRTDAAPAPVGAYPHARRVGNLLFLSGVGPRQPGSNAIPGNVHDADGRLAGYDIEAQCRQVFANVRAVLEANPSAAEDYRAGKGKTFGFLVGQVMKATGGKANPKTVNEALRKLLDAPGP